MCAYTVVLQTILSITNLIVMGGTGKKGSTEGDMVYEVSNKPIGICLTACRYTSEQDMLLMRFFWTGVFQVQPCVIKQNRRRYIDKPLSRDEEERFCAVLLPF